MNILKRILAIFASMIMFWCLVGAAVIGGIRYGALKGGDLDEILDKSKAYDAVDEVGRLAIIETLEHEGMSKDIVACIPDDMIAVMSQDIIQSIQKGEVADFSNMIDYSAEFSDNLTVYIVDTTYEELDRRGTINADTIYNIPYFEDINKATGVKVDEKIVNYFSLTDKPVRVSDVITEDKKKEFNEYVGQVISKELEKQLEKNIDKWEDEFNNELQGESGFVQLYEAMQLANDSLKLLEVLPIVLIIIGLVIGSLNVLIYRKNIIRGIKRVGNVFLFSGIISLLIVFGLAVVEKYMRREVTKEGSEFAQAPKLADFACKLFTNTAEVIRSFGVVYLICAVAIIVIASIFKGNKTQTPKEPVVTDKNQDLLDSIYNK